MVRRYKQKLSFYLLKFTKMAEAVLKFTGLSVGQKILRVRAIVKATTGNSVYATPNPTLAAITAAVDQLEEDEADVETGIHGAVTIRDLQETLVDNMMIVFLAYVQVTSGGDQVKIESTTIAVKGGKSAPHPMGKLLGASGTVGAFSGQSVLKWKKMEGAKYYVIQTSVDGLTNWTTVGEPVTKTTATITGLVAETGAFYRIAAGNSTGIGAWCNPIRVMAM